MSNFALPPPPPDYPIRMNHFELPPPPLDYPIGYQMPKAINPGSTASPKAINPGSTASPKAINPTATASASDACGGTFGVLSPSCFGVWLSSHATDALVITIGIVLLIAGMFALVHGKQILETVATAAA
jgi:hypothetical protein